MWRKTAAFKKPSDMACSMYLYQYVARFYFFIPAFAISLHAYIVNVKGVAETFLTNIIIVGTLLSVFLQIVPAALI
jgi:hypothetical protein